MAALAAGVSPLLVRPDRLKEFVPCDYTPPAEEKGA
jgi:hypothetical protein